MAEFFSRRDVDFLLYEWLDVVKMTKRDHFAEHSRDTFSEAGLMAGSFDEAVGGMQLPTVVSQACMAFFRAANPSTTSYAFLTVGNANLLVEYGTDEQIDTWVRPMLEGRYFGTMCLSEPDAGSSLTDITTKAVPAADGTYRITGTKMWITGGDHELTENIVH